MRLSPNIAVMKMPGKNKLSISISLVFVLIAAMLLISPSCEKEPDPIVPTDGYVWPDNERDYWPTQDWRIASMEDHNMDPSKMAIADDFAENYPLARALLVIKDGYLVFENYYGDGGVDQSTDLWSVTKSVTSAVLGILMDNGSIRSTSQLMADLMPDYPQFNKITLYHVLTQTTGLSWTESGAVWANWIFSDDWVAHALSLGAERDPGERFFYSSMICSLSGPTDTYLTGTFSSFSRKLM